MKKTTWLLAALVAVVLYGAWKVNERRNAESAFALLEEARELIAESPDQASLAQRLLDRGLALGPPPALTEALLTERANLRRASGAYALALQDWRALAELHPEDDSIKLTIAGLEIQLGNSPEAVAIYTQILEGNPNNGWAQALLAMTQLRQASATRDATLEQLGDLVSLKDIRWLRSRFDRTVRLPSSDPIRQGLLAELQARLPQEALVILTPAMASVEGTLTQARSDFATSLKSSVNPSNLYGLIDSVYRAGRLEDTVDAGLAMLNFEDSTNHPGTIQDLALALDELERPLAASAIVNEVVKDKPNWHYDFLDGWCSILYKAEAWPQLQSAASQLLRVSSPAPGDSGRSDAAFYLGMAAFNLDHANPAVASLKQFIGSHNKGPVEDAVPIAWLTLAAAHESLGNKDQAHSAYSGCAEAAPGYSAAAWLDMADKAAPHEGQELSESIYLAHAIACSPERSGELTPRMLEVGRRGLEQRGIDVPAMAAQLRTNGRWYPAGSNAPYLLLSLAQEYLRTDQAAGAAIVLERLLRDLPGFPPAYELLAQAHAQLGRPPEQAKDLLDWISLVGPSPTGLAQLSELASQLEDEQLPGPLLRRWMELDPEFVGAMELARELLRQGQAAKAYDQLSAVPRTLFSDRDRILFAQILADLGQPEALLQATDDIDPSGASLATACLSRIAAAAQCADFEALEGTLEQLIEMDCPCPEGSPNEALLEAALEALLEHDLGPALLPFTSHFAQAPHSRCARRMTEAALAELLAGSPEQASIWLDQADALTADGSPLVGRMLLRLNADDLTGLTQTVRDLRDEQPAWLDATDLALLAGLEGRLGEARGLIEAQLTQAPADSVLWLATAALDAIQPQADGTTDFTALSSVLGGAARKPLERIARLDANAGRLLLVTLLARHAPVWRMWSLDRIADPAQAKLLGPFAVQLAAEDKLERGQLEAAQALLVAGAEQWKAFLPFWDLNEDLTLSMHGRADHPALVSLRRKRRMVGVPPRGGIAPTAAELALDASAEAAALGNTELAIQKAQEACKASPKAGAPQLFLARVASGSAPELAQAAYLKYLLSEDWPLEDPELPGLLDELFRLPAELTRPELESLNLRFPSAPQPVLGLAKLDLEELGLEAAYRRLDDFAAAEPALEELAPGSSRAWFDFLSSYSPARALELAEQQLDRSPRHLTSWLQVAEGLDRVGQRQASLELWRVLRRMSADPAVGLGQAALVASIGGSHVEVMDALKLAIRSPEAKSKAALIEFIKDRSLANTGSDFFDQAIEGFESLLASGETPGVQRSLIQRRLGTTLLHRGQRGDGVKALVHLSAALASTEEPLERDLLTGLANLARQLDKELDRQAKAAAETPSE